MRLLQGASLSCEKRRYAWYSNFSEPPLQRRGRRFEPVTAHETNTQVRGSFCHWRDANTRSTRREIQQKSNIRSHFHPRPPSALGPNPTESNIGGIQQIQVTHVGPDLQFATAEVAKSTAEGLGSSSDGPSAASSAEEKHSA
jgi:hypothetical protein